MSAFQDDEYDDEYYESEIENNQSNSKKLLAIVFITLGLISSTVAANISIGNGRIEMGQGLYQIKACDQWVAIGLFPTAAIYSGKSRVQTMELIGLDPRLCKNVIFRIKMFKKSSPSTPLPLFTGVTGTDTNTATMTTGNVTQVSLYDSATVTYPTVSYNSYASKALTLVNMANANVGYDDTYHRISYYATAGTYRIYFVTPLCLMEDVDRITIESASLTS
jgi:hypothetical protein